METLAQHQWHFLNPVWYFCIGLVFAIAIRIFVSIFSAFHLYVNEGIGWWTGFMGVVTAFIFADEKYHDKTDYGLPFVIGLLEMYGLHPVPKTPR
jgi:hypothetical protein